MLNMALTSTIGSCEALYVGDPNMVEMPLAGALAGQGWGIRVRTGADVVAENTKLSSALVLVDVGLETPVSGMDICAVLRARDSEKYIVAVLRSLDRGRALEALAKGASDYLVADGDSELF